VTLTPIEHEKLTCRAWNVLQNNDLGKYNVGVNLEAISSMTDDMFLALENCGRKTLKEVENLLASYGKKFTDDFVEADWATELWADALMAHGMWVKSKTLRRKGPNINDIAAIKLLRLRFEQMMNGEAP
jgi:hypothetical protein